MVRIGHELARKVGLGQFQTLDFKFVHILVCLRCPSGKTHVKFMIQYTQPNILFAYTMRFSLSLTNFTLQDLKIVNELVNCGHSLVTTIHSRKDTVGY